MVPLVVGMGMLGVVADEGPGRVSAWCGGLGASVEDMELSLLSSEVLGDEEATGEQVKSFVPGPVKTSLAACWAAPEDVSSCSRLTMERGVLSLGRPRDPLEDDVL